MADSTKGKEISERTEPQEDRNSGHCVDGMIVKEQENNKVSAEDGDDENPAIEASENEEESEEEPPEMTAEERKDMYAAVKDGDIDLLEKLLEKPNADITMTFFEENLLVGALRAEQLEMAEFLLDNGVDHTFKAKLVHPAVQCGTKNAHPKKVLEVFQYSCRQMAYDKGFMDIVEMIDVLDGRLFPGLKPRRRTPRIRRPPPTPVSSLPSGDTESLSSLDDDFDVKSETKKKTARNEDVSARKIANSQEGRKDGFSKSDSYNKIVKSKESLDEASSEACRKAHSKGESETGPKASEADGSAFKIGEKTHTERLESEDADIRQDGSDTRTPSSVLYSTTNSKHGGTRLQGPSIPVKPTRASEGIRCATDTHSRLSMPSRHSQARPLEWRKVHSAGSYAAESPLWHISSPCHLEKSPPPGARRSTSPRNLPSRAVLKPVGPSRGSSLSSRAVSDLANAVPSLSAAQCSRKVPSYMRMTASCYVKRRLDPNFTNSYSSLEFVENEPKRSPKQALVIERTTNRSALSRSSNQGLIIERTTNRSVLGQVSLRPVGKGPGAIPSIRNASSVFQMSKLNTVSNKDR